MDERTKNIQDQMNKPLAVSIRTLIDTRDGGNGEVLRKFLGCTQQSISNYRLGISTPKTETLIKIAQFYGVSMDWMYGLSETSSPNIEDQAICKRTGLSEAALKNILDVPGNDTNGLLLDTLNSLLSHPGLVELLVDLNIASFSLDLAKQTVDELKQKADGRGVRSDTAASDLQMKMKSLLEFKKFEDKAEYYLFRASKIITEALKKVVEPEGGATWQL